MIRKKQKKEAPIKKNNNITNNSPLKIFKWIPLSLFYIVDHIITSIVQIFTYAYTGIVFLLTKSSILFYYIVDIIYCTLLGIKSVFFDFPQHLYLGVSGSVDRTYRATKNTINETVEKQHKFKNFWIRKYNDLSFVKDRKMRLENERKALLESLNTDDAKRTQKATVYKYKVKDKEGKFITGTFTGFSKLDVNAFLVNEGYTVYNIETSNMITFLYGNSSVVVRKLSNKDLIFWLTQLSTYIKSGIPLTDSVKIISNQMGKNNRQKRIYESIVYELTMGESFSKALEKQGTIFPSLLINMLKAAEATGELAETLDDMADYYTETEKTRKQIISAMTYPSIIMVFAITVITFIMLYVIPQFTEVYESVDAEISGITAGIVDFSNFLQSNITLIAIVILAAIVGITVMYQRIKAFRTVMQTALMKMPIIGNIMIYKEITIFTKTFASLLKNNVFITESIDILSKITNNEIYKTIMFTTISNIAKGEKISLAFKNHWAIPEVAYHMIVTGESTGELSTMMARVSDYFQDMNRNSVNSLKSLIEPIMIVSLALVVGIVVLAVIMPMFGLYENIQM